MLLLLLLLLGHWAELWGIELQTIAAAAAAAAAAALPLLEWRG
jgi:hypothetical protein